MSRKKTAAGLPRFWSFPELWSMAADPGGSPGQGAGLALRVVAERLDHGEMLAEPINILFAAA